MKIYISGKMTGLSKRQILRNFKCIEKELIKQGHSVMNPSVMYYHIKTDGFSYDDWLKIDFSMIDVCDGIYLMKNWKDSKGAKLEFNYAKKNNKTIIEEYDEKEINTKRKVKIPTVYKMEKI